MKNYPPRKGCAARSKIFFTLLSVFLLATATNTFAQTATPTPTSRRADLPEALKNKKATHKPAPPRKLMRNGKGATKPSATHLTPVQLKEKTNTLRDSLQHVVRAKSAMHKAPHIPGNVSYTVINTGQNTFGYDVYNNGHKIIHQVIIPGVAGRNGFKSREDAEKVAQLVTGKMKKGQTMPAVSANEIRALNISLN